MLHNNHAPSETPEQVCARAVTDNADIMTALRRLLEKGASRTQMGQIAEATKQIKAQVSSLKCDLASWLSRTDNRPDPAKVLRDHLGVAAM